MVILWHEQFILSLYNCGDLCSIRHQCYVFFRRTRSSVWSCCSKKLLSFRFLASWITHNDFQRLVRSNWNPFIPWNDLLNNFRRELQRWNKEGFGNIFFLEKKLIKRLDKLNWQLGGGGNVHSIDVFFLLCGRNMRKFCFKKRFYGSKNLALSGLPLVIVIVNFSMVLLLLGSDVTKFIWSKMMLVTRF